MNEVARTRIPKNPRIVLLANGIVGLKIASYLELRHENIVALVLHPKNNAEFDAEIKRAIRIAEQNIFFANQLSNTKVLSKIRALKPDLAICAWFGDILKKNFIDIFPSGVLNIHNSYLPYNRGKYPHVWAMYEGLPYGVTIHFIDERIDTGDIIVRQRVGIKITDTAGDIYNRSLDEAVALFKAKWTLIKFNQFHSIKQDNKIATSHFAKEIAKLDFIDFKKRYTAEDLINRLRARSFKDRSYAYFLHKGKKVYVQIFLSENINFKK